jgi:predicted Rossmann fold flavoprotein
MSDKIIDLLIVGGGAAGFFTAINYAEKNPTKSVVILEKGKQVLGKVKVSGGGRCNVTHACFEPRELVKFYPRGNRELMGPFSQFMTGDTMEWFENRGVSLKIEDDNRIFPISDDSQTIIDCFMDEVSRLGIKVMKQQSVSNINFEKENWKVETISNDFIANRIVLASGGNSKAILESIENLGLKTIENIPSLFTFNTKDTRFRGLAGVVAPLAGVKIASTKFKESGPLLITHWGVSGPSILKLSSISARELHEIDYKFTIQIDWCLSYDAEDVKETFSDMRDSNPKKAIINTNLFDLPKRLWVSLVEFAKIPNDKIWAEVGKKDLNRLQEIIKNSQIQINGKSTNKEEFVSCGGVDLKEIDFSNFSSKKHPSMHIVGELLNIDALTGGFNFQAAWTGGYVTASGISE